MLLNIILAVSLAGAVGALIYLVRKIGHAHDDLNEFFVKAGQLEKENLVLKNSNDSWQNAYETLGKNCAALKVELTRSDDARKMAEKQRDDLLAEIAKNGNVKVLASAVNKELAEFRKIGFSVKP